MIDYNTLEQDIDEIRQRHLKDLGDKDLKYLATLESKWSRNKEEGLRLIEESVSPVRFLEGVKKYSYGYVIESFVAHNILHCQYDTLSPDKYCSSLWHWPSPIDTQGWKREHNGQHHIHTNVVEKDPDLAHGILRTHHEIPWSFIHLFQMPIYFLGLYPTFNKNWNGIMLRYVENIRQKIFKSGNKGYGIMSEDRTLLTPTEAAQREKHTNATIKEWNEENIYGPARNSKSWTPKVALGLKMAEILTNYQIAMTIQPSHQAEEKYPQDYVPKSKGEWYFMQMETTRNYELEDQERLDYYGALNYQIEHHLYPDIPSWRYMDISREVKGVCKKHGILYREDKTRKQTYLRFVKEVLKYSIPDFFRHKLFGKSKLEKNPMKENTNV